MNLYTAIKADLMAAILGKLPEKEILRVVLGELDTINAKREVTHDDCLKTIRKCIEANNEILKIKPDQKLVFENEILSGYLPNELNVKEISDKLEGVSLGNNLGKAIGIAVKYLRDQGLYANGKDVRVVVETILKENCDS